MSVLSGLLRIRAALDEPDAHLCFKEPVWDAVSHGHVGSAARATGAASSSS